MIWAHGKTGASWSKENCIKKLAHNCKLVDI